MKPALFALILALISYSSLSQTINGTISDLNTKEPVSGAHIYLKKLDKGAISDEDGNFQLITTSKNELNDTLIISHISYQTKKITLNQFKEQNYKLALVPLKKELSEVEIKADKVYKSHIKFEKVTNLASRQYAFGSAKTGNKIIVVGGDESAFSGNTDMRFEELNYSSSNTPALDLDEMLRIITRPRINYNSYNGHLQIYDIASNNWKFITSQFEKRAYHNIHFYKDKIYVIGGKRISKSGQKEYLADKIEVYDTKNYSVKVDKTNPHQAVNFASVLYKDNVILIGGSIKLLDNGEKEYTPKVHLYNITSGYWYELGNMPQEKEVTGILIDDKIYLVGGFYKKMLNYIETFDLKTNKWEVEAELFTGMFRPALAYHNNILYIFENGKLCTYNILTKKLNEYKIGLYLSSAAMYYANNKLFIMGGFQFDDYSITPLSKVYSINLNEFIDTKINNSKSF
jgi:hypothetical protein